MIMYISENQETTEELLRHHEDSSPLRPKKHTTLIVLLILAAVIIIGLIFFSVWYFFVYNQPLRSQLSGVWYTNSDSYGVERIVYFNSPSSYIEATKNGNSVDEFYCDYSLVGNRVDSKLIRYTVDGTEMNSNNIIGDDLPMDVEVKNGRLIESVGEYLKNNYMKEYVKNETVTFEKSDLSYDEALKKYFDYSSSSGGKV